MAADGSVIIEIKGDAKEFNASIENATASAKNLGDTSVNAVNALASALAAAGVAASIREIAQALRDCVGASIEFESAMTGVFKTVDGTDAQLAAISDGIKRMSTEIPASTTEIAAVAEAAGQLGIATEDVLSFSRVMLDLGESTNLSADQAATALARFANITGTSAADYERLGSTIVALGNSFATTEAEITEMATRLASAGTMAGLTETDILALAAAMSSVGINAEAGGTAMAQTLGAIEEAAAKGGDKLETFAEIAGMSAQEFSTAWEADAISAVQAFIAGIAELEEQGDSAVLVLDDLGLTGVRQGNMIKSLALASKTMAGSVSLANRAWAENTALAEEANKRYETTESKLAMLNNAFNNVKAAVGDALAPALKELAEVGTDAFSWAAEFIEQNPELVQVLTGLTAAIATFAGGLTAVGAAIPIIHAVKTALVGLPAGPIVAVVGALSALAGAAVMVGASAASVEGAADAYHELAESIRESRDAYQETQSELGRQADDTLAMVDAIEKLAAAEQKTEAEKLVLQGLIDDLNEAVPGLNLAYEEQSDALSMTTEELHEYVQALADQQRAQEAIGRMTEVSVQLSAVSAELQQAQQDLAIAEQEQQNTLVTGVNVTERAMSANAQLSQSIWDLKDAIAALEAEQGLLTAEYDALSEQYDAIQEDIHGTTSAAAEAVPALAELTGQTADLSAELEGLSSALQEQQEQGSLSLDTTTALIDAGYAAALSIDEETGAVTLNREAYLELARAKLDEQIAAVEARKASMENAIQLKKEEIAALELARAYARVEAAYQELAGMEADYTSYEVLTAALEKARAGLGSYAEASVSASRTASRAAQTQAAAASQAERDLATYQELRAALDHQRNLELVDERDYYAQLKEYRDAYLTDEDNLDAYRRVTEEIYGYDKALADKEAKLWASQAEAIMRQREQMVQRLSDYGDLFTVKDGVMSLEDLQKQVDAVKEYGAALESLKTRGVSESLLGEITTLDISDATDYTNKLLEMTDAEYKQYMALWEEKQAEASKVAAQFYNSELAALESEFVDKIPESMSGLKEELVQVGENAADGLAEGFSSRAQSVISAFVGIAHQAVAALNNSLGIHSPSTVFADIGGYMAEGLGLGFERKMKGVSEQMQNAIPTPEVIAQVHRISAALQEAVQSEAIRVSAGLSVSSGAREEAQRAAMDTQSARAISRSTATGRDIVLQVNGREFARATLEDFRAVEHAVPRIEDD